MVNELQNNERIYSNSLIILLSLYLVVSWLRGESPILSEWIALKAG